jgi:SAM-dependent methyltransferase
VKTELQDFPQEKIPEEFRDRYTRHLMLLKQAPGSYQIFPEPVFETGGHPANFVDYECAFASQAIQRLNPPSLLDVGSYRHFLLGLLAHYPVTSVDIRNRIPLTPTETILTGDAKRLDLPDHSFAVVLSLCALEHFGLGRYGDPVDFQADQKAFLEMVRVIQPGGHLIFSTTVTRGRPAIGFNAHRIYSYPLLRNFCAGLTLCEERFYSHQLKGFCSFAEVTADPQGWDVYCGCWQKPNAFTTESTAATEKKAEI